MQRGGERAAASPTVSSFGTRPERSRSSSASPARSEVDEALAFNIVQPELSTDAILLNSIARVSTKGEWFSRRSQCKAI